MIRSLAPRRSANWVGSGMLVAMLTPPGRAWLESGMALHMLVQFPSAVLAGALLVLPDAQSRMRRVAHFNRYGMSGLCYALFALSLLMIPRVLDFAVADVRADWFKMVVLALTGVAMRLSWPVAPAVIKGFFLGNILPMMVVVGALYLQAPQRLCNVYLADEQRRVGLILIAGAVIVTLTWLMCAAMGWSGVRQTGAVHPRTVKSPELITRRGS